MTTVTQSVPVQAHHSPTVLSALRNPKILLREVLAGLVVALASSSGPLHPVAGFDRAALVSAGLCLVGAVIAARCRQSPHSR